MTNDLKPKKRAPRLMTKEQRAFIKKHGAKVPPHQLALSMGLPVEAVRAALENAGMIKKGGAIPLSDQEKEFIRINVDKMTVPQLAKRFHRTENAMNVFVHHLKKDMEE